MANVQALFEQFHAKIRMSRDNATLQEKKDILLRRIKKWLADNEKPSCREYLQGSYKMKVGVCALEGAEFDIDVGLRFDFDDTAYTAAEVREWIYAAVDGHADTDLDDKGPCIRVTYKDGYHVDLVSYAWWDDANETTQYRLAHKQNGWLPADPPALVDFVKKVREPFEGSEDAETSTDQFRRLVRALKRWNDFAILGDAPEKPSGLALLLLTEQHVSAPVFDAFGDPDDRAALETIAHTAANTLGRIKANKPTPEYEDMFGRLTASQMTTLKERFGELDVALVTARTTTDVQVACKALKKVFGSDFPCPTATDQEKQSALRTSAPAIIPHTKSA